MEVQNISGQKNFTERELTRKHKLLILAAKNQNNQPGTLACQDIGWIANATGTFHTMLPLTIKCWIQNVLKRRKWFRKRQVIIN